MGKLLEAGMAIGDAKATGAPSCRRNLNVENAVNDLDGAVADLREALEALEHHIAPLLGSERPQEVGGDRTQGESDLAERILCNADRIRARSARIRELIDRL